MQFNFAFCRVFLSIVFAVLTVFSKNPSYQGASHGLAFQVTPNSKFVSLYKVMYDGWSLLLPNFIILLMNDCEPACGTRSYNISHSPAHVYNVIHTLNSVPLSFELNFFLKKIKEQNYLLR